MTTTTSTPQRQPGRPRKPAPVVEATPVQEQAPQVQYTIAKLTAHMLAGEIHRLHQEGEDLTPIHQVSDAIRAAVAPVVEAVQASPVTAKEDTEQPVNAPTPENLAELKAAVEAAKTNSEKPRTFAVSYLNKRGKLKLAHGVEYEDGDIDIHEARGFAAQYADDMDELHETAQKRHGNGYHVDYTDEP